MTLYDQMYHPTGASNTTTNESNVPQKHPDLREAVLKIICAECRQHEHRHCKSSVASANECYGALVDQLLRLLSEHGMVQLDPIQGRPEVLLYYAMGESNPEGLQRAYLKGQQMMFEAGWRKVLP